MRHVFTVPSALLAIVACVQLFVGVRSGATCVQTNGLVLLVLAIVLLPVKPPRIVVEARVPGPGDTQAIGASRKDPNA